MWPSLTISVSVHIKGSWAPPPGRPSSASGPPAARPSRLRGAARRRAALPALRHRVPRPRKEGLSIPEGGIAHRTFILLTRHSNPARVGLCSRPPNACTTFASAPLLRNLDPDPQRPIGLNCCLRRASNSHCRPTVTRNPSRMPPAPPPSKLPPRWRRDRRHGARQPHGLSPVAYVPSKISRWPSSAQA